MHGLIGGFFVGMITAFAGVAIISAILGSAIFSVFVSLLVILAAVIGNFLLYLMKKIYTLESSESAKCYDLGSWIGNIFGGLLGGLTAATNFLGMLQGLPASLKGWYLDKNFGNGGGSASC